MRHLMLILALLTALPGFSQSLTKERIRKIGGRKRSIYLESGIFHTGSKSVSSTLRAVRQSYVKSRGYERIVFDFETGNIPKIYGYVSKAEKKIYIDFFKTKVHPEVGSFGSSKHVEKINFFRFGDDSLSVELKFKFAVVADIFYLERPGRLVIDVKK